MKTELDIFLATKNTKVKSFSVLVTKEECTINHNECLSVQGKILVKIYIPKINIPNDVFGGLYVDKEGNIFAIDKNLNTTNFTFYYVDKSLLEKPTKKLVTIEEYFNDCTVGTDEDHSVLVLEHSYHLSGEEFLFRGNYFINIKIPMLDGIFGTDNKYILKRFDNNIYYIDKCGRLKPTLFTIKNN